MTEGTWERWNTHFSTVVEQEVFGINFQLAQDPNSHNLGTTVWDASIVLAKWLEKNARRGDFSRQRARGRRCLELGSGMGLGGLAFALLGAEVMLTDLAPVLPLLERNYQHNLAPAVLRVGDATWAAEVVGRVGVQELDWSRPEQYKSFRPPYDYILAADCVYSELAVPSFLATVLHMSDPKTHVVVVNEFRSQSVHDTFMAAFQRHFMLKKVPPSKMDAQYQHPLIHIYLCKKRKQPLAADALATAAEAILSGDQPHGDLGNAILEPDATPNEEPMAGPPVAEAPSGQAGEAGNDRHGQNCAAAAASAEAGGEQQPAEDLRAALESSNSAGKPLACSQDPLPAPCSLQQQCSPSVALQPGAEGDAAGAAASAAHATAVPCRQHTSSYCPAGAVEKHAAQSRSCGSRLEEIQIVQSRGCDGGAGGGLALSPASAAAPVSAGSSKLPVATTLLECSSSVATQLAETL